MRYKASIRTGDLVTYRIGGGWGNAVNWHNIEQRKVVGWKTPRPTIGDLLLSEMRSGKTGIFKFVDVEYESDPNDMFWGTVEDLGYQT